MFSFTCLTVEEYMKYSDPNLTLHTDDDGDVGGDNQITEKSICKGNGKAAELMQRAIRDLT